MANEKVDVVIVGAGASGSVYASVLAKAGKKVVLLDNGPDWQLNDLISSEFWGRRLKPAGAPILLEEAKAAQAKPAAKPGAPTPACDKMKSIGQWNTAWDPFFELDPVWTDAFMAAGAAIYGSSMFTPKEIELLSIAFDASYTHMYAPGTRRHIKGALAAGAMMEEIMEVLKLCVVQGVQACNLGVPILAEELERLQEQM